MISTGESRLVVGCMSGTSLDGIDVVLVHIQGSGRSLKLDVLHADDRSWPADTRSRLLDLADTAKGPATSRIGETEILHQELASIYAEVIQDVVRASGRTMDEVDAVGNHGQTVFHDPDQRVTLQIGDPALLASLLDTTVVADFRQADVSLGGQGAPLVPYMDWALFTDDSEHRLLLNLGGIANVTSLPPGAQPDDVLAFDTGPANMLVDALAQRLLSRSHDEGGLVALDGTVDESVLDTLMTEPYFGLQPPKSTGRELFGSDYVDRLLGLTEHLDTASRLATAAALTARSVADAVDRFIPGQPERMWVSGGGVHNQAIMQGLKERLAPIHVESLLATGFDPDAKEAVCFAILAHEALNGVPTGMPSVTGASGRAFSGKIFRAGTTSAS